MKIADIKTPELKAIAKSLENNSTSTHTQVRILWNMVFGWAMEHDKIQKDYSQYVKFYSNFVPKEKKAFTKEEVALFSDDLQILCYTGLRIGEYLSLTANDIRDGCLYVKGTKTEAANRIVPIHEKIATRLSQRLVEGVGMRYHEFAAKVFIPEMESLGLSAHTTKDTRRTFATFASRSKMDKVMVKRILGHKLDDITEKVYTEKNEKDLIEEMAKFIIL